MIIENTYILNTYMCMFRGHDGAKENRISTPQKLKKIETFKPFQPNRESLEINISQMDEFAMFPYKWTPVLFLLLYSGYRSLQVLEP